MADITTPVQTRFIDPFSAYDSNVVSGLTRLVTKGVDCILSNNELDIIPRNTTSVSLTPGSCVKDDIFITVDDAMVVDFMEPLFFERGNIFSRAGYYYIVLKYDYEKTDPAPEASIRIIDPDHHTQVSDYILLKVVGTVRPSGEPLPLIDSLEDYDPDNTEIQRQFSQVFIGLSSTLPEFDVETDKGRFLFILEGGSLYVGGLDHWINISYSDYRCDTGDSQIGNLVYIGAGNIAIKANGRSETTFAAGFVIQAGTPGVENGTVRFNGLVIDGIMQDGIVPVANDSLYLSVTVGEEGTATTEKPTDYTPQYIGRCISYDSGTHRYSAIFIPTVGIPEHNLLEGKQGGTEGEYYHLTDTERTKLDALTNVHNELDGLQGGTAGFPGYRIHLTQAEYNKLVQCTPNHEVMPQGLYNADGLDHAGVSHFHLDNDLQKLIFSFYGDHNLIPLGLQGGESDQRYHLSYNEYEKVQEESFDHNKLTGKDGGDTSFFYHLGETDYHKIVNFEHDTLNDIHGASNPGNNMHLTPSEYNKLVGTPYLPPGSIIAWLPVYFTNGSNAGAQIVPEVGIGANTVAAAKSWLKTCPLIGNLDTGWRLCDGSADVDNGWWSNPRYLPNLTDDRFLSGSTTAGTSGGSNDIVAHTHTISGTSESTTLNESQIPSHTHPATLSAGPGPGDDEDQEGYIKTGGSMSVSVDFTGGGLGHTHGVGTYVNSPAGAHDNRPKYLTCFYIIKVG